ncbi:hypothetical protein [Dactylosporangium sp. CA-139066]|uniref:hypothetical protein n=1 Tax=Dactylosporangium sp. CA-139066 TaxID=3239930 RepID=UPI003D943558
MVAAPAVPPADLTLLEPLLARLDDPAGVAGTERFPLGTLQPDGQTGRAALRRLTLGPDVPRRVRRALAELLPGGEPPLASEIVSVYR